MQTQENAGHDQLSGLKVPRARSHPAERGGGRLPGATLLVARFVMLFAHWAILSGMFDPFHLSLGAAASAFVVWLTRDFVPPGVERGLDPRFMLRMLGYLVWLLMQIIMANFAMLRLVFHPRMNDLIDPQIVEFKTRLTSKLALATLANSITLTPGTITVTIDERGYVTVHAIDKRSAEGGFGEMENRIARVYGEA